MLEFLGGVIAIHNVIRYLYLQKRYLGGGLTLVIFYVLAILIFTFRIVQISIIVFNQTTSEKVGYIIGTFVVILEVDVGFAMILLMRQLQTMLKSVVVF